MKERRMHIYAGLGLWVALTVSVAWTATIVLAPLAIAPGTVTGLDGAANRIDYGDLWGRLPPAQAAVYYLGDIECHQKATRTIFLNGNQMPVCSRDASLFFFLSLGLALAAIVRPHFEVGRTLVRLLPKKLRRRLETGKRSMLFAWALAVACLAPLVVDAGLQLVTPYESTNAVRFLTGIPAGMFLGLALGLMIQAIHVLPSLRQVPQRRERPSQ